MKKLAIILLASTICSTAWAGSLTPKTAFEKCLVSVEKSAKEAGLKNPFGGGDIQAWNDFTRPKYNLCWCNHKGKPIQGFSCGE